LALVAYHNFAAPCRSPPGYDFGYPAFTDALEIHDVMIIVKKLVDTCRVLLRPPCWPFLTLSTRNEGRKQQLFHYSHFVGAVGLLCVSLVLLSIEAEKRTAESPGSKAEVHHWKPAPGEAGRTLADVYLVVEDLWYASRLTAFHTANN